MLYEMQRIDSKYDQLSLTKVRFLTLNEVEEKLQAQNFKKGESRYYKKRKLSFFRDSIHYHVRCIQSINAVGDIEKETRRFEKWSKKPKNSILILIVYAEQISDSEFKFLKHKSKLDIISAKISKNTNQSMGITVLVDKRNYDGYYLDIYPKQSISNYGYACRFVKKQLIK